LKLNPPLCISRFFKSYPRRRFFFLTALAVYTGANLPILGEELRRLFRYQKVLNHNVVGYQFMGLEKFTTGVGFISYFTDGNLEDPDRLKLFTQAQLVLAPAILDPNNLNHEYILFVCKNELAAWKIIRQLNLIPLLRNDKYGIILAKRR
jgi:hypothetical protein